MSLEEKWEKDKQPLQPIKNNHLFCKTCKHLLKDKTCSCKMFLTKPISVLKGGVCDGYKKG